MPLFLTIACQGVQCPAGKCFSPTSKAELAGILSAEANGVARCCVDTSAIDDLSNMGRPMGKFGADEEICWDTSNVGTLRYLFFNAPNFNEFGEDVSL